MKNDFSKLLIIRQNGKYSRKNWSLINSVFVDAMVSDNNDDVKAKLDELEKKIDKLLEKQDNR